MILLFWNAWQTNGNLWRYFIFKSWWQKLFYRTLDSRLYWNIILNEKVVVSVKMNLRKLPCLAMIFSLCRTVLVKHSSLELPTSPLSVLVSWPVLVLTSPSWCDPFSYVDSIRWEYKTIQSTYSIFLKYLMDCISSWWHLHVNVFDLPCI